MTDYFGALIRSAGLSAAAAVQTPAESDADLVEQHVEVDAQADTVAIDSTPRSHAVQPQSEPVHAPPGRMDEPDARPPRSNTTTPETPRIELASVPSRPQALPPAPIAAPSPIDTLAAPVHPVVRAALKWVAADPTVRRESALPAPQAAVRARRTEIEPGHARVPHEPEAPLGPSRTLAPARPVAWADPPGPPARQVAARAVEPAPPPPGTAASPAPAAPSAELHIGAIHVTVDAPRTAAATPPAAAPAPTRPAPTRSAYLRSRAPRV